jgi:hypothetical protein
MNKFDNSLLIRVLSELNYDQQSLVKKFTKKCVREIKRNNFKYCHPPREFNQLAQIRQSEISEDHDLVIQEYNEKVPNHVTKLVDLMGALYPPLEPVEKGDGLILSQYEKTLVERSQNPKEFIKWLKKYPLATAFQKEHTAPMDRYTADDVTLDGDGISIRVN